MDGQHLSNILSLLQGLTPSSCQFTRLSLVQGHVSVEKIDIWTALRPASYVVLAACSRYIFYKHLNVTGKSFAFAKYCAAVTGKYTYLDHCCSPITIRKALAVSRKYLCPCSSGYLLDAERRAITMYTGLRRRCTNRDSP
jgi:hypothetical protein